MARFNAEARKTARQLNELLAALSEQAGVELAWDSTELKIIDVICGVITRKQELNDEYESATEAKVKVKLAAEIRLTESHLARLLKQSRPSVPQPVSRRSARAREAANARWSRTAG
jgi:short-subunit dehydrogenase involved in D-alanine esterification of teichoic acids